MQRSEKSGNARFFPHSVPHRFSTALWRGCRIGILGGSFNPAHAGHLYVSELALKRFALDQVWWMVSPQNPMKEAGDMAPLAKRIESAELLTAHHPRLCVTAIETEFGTRHTAETLARLHRFFPKTRFLWLMGTDNLAQIPRWRDWESIFRQTPVAVMTRTPYAMSVLKGNAATRFRASRVQPARLAAYLGRGKIGWSYILNLPHPASATAIRRGTRWPQTKTVSLNQEKRKTHGDDKIQARLPQSPPPEKSRGREKTPAVQAPARRRNAHA